MEMIDWLMGSGIIWLLLPVYFPYGLSHSRTLQSYCLLSDKTLTLIDLTIFPLNLHWVKPPFPPLNHSPARRPADELVVLPTGKHQKSSSCVTSIGATKRRPPEWLVVVVVVGASCLPPSYGESGQRNDPHIPKRAGITSICPRTVCNLWSLDELLPSYIHINRFYINTHGCVSRNWIIALDSIVPMKGSCSLLRHGKPGQTISPELSDVLTRLGMERF